MATIFTPINYLCRLAAFCGLLFMSAAAFGQPNTTVDLDKDKPKQYEDRKLVSEKSGDSKFGAIKKIYQNTVTHYNYYFNANRKLNDVIEQAKLAHVDDYTQLLPFYNYNLDGTAKFKNDLDSVIYKCNAGVLLHDLRGDWIDDLYMLLGKAYLFRKTFDSATQVFQYVNYIFAPKDGGYDIPIGSSASNTRGVFTVATNEKTGMFSGKPPSRNESFVWQSRNYLEQGKVAEASGLLSLLRSDPNFPQRLQTDLHEMIAYCFYVQKVYDSSAWHLQKALDNAADHAEKARWEYLCGQMYGLAGRNEAAIGMFQHAINHTQDPYMDVYSRLNMVTLASSKNKDNALQNNLNELYKLAKRDKYEDYRDILYFAAALLQLQLKNDKAAQAELRKSIKFSVENPLQKQKSFLMLADISYNNKNYEAASHFYDSVQTTLFEEADKQRVEARKPALKIINNDLITIHTEDSLQVLAKMSPEERTAAIKKLLKQLLKAAGLKDSSNLSFGNNPVAGSAQSLFNTNSGGSDFYFLSNNLKAQGYADFKAKWGNRPNADNWQRQSAITKLVTNPTGSATDVVDKRATTPEKKDLTFDGLQKDIPLTPEKLEASDRAIGKALFTNGVTFMNMLEEYPAAAESFENLLHRYPESGLTDTALFDLAYCYRKMGLLDKADSVKARFTTLFPKSKLGTPIKSATAGKASDVASRKYESIYNLFVEGKFQQAKDEKLKADEQYGNTYWTPQLLYIESIYYVKQRQDSIAINRLKSLATTFPKSPLAEKANTMIDVLKRRNQIEGYLTNLDVEKKEDAVQKRIDLNTNDASAIKKKTVNTDSITQSASKQVDLTVDKKLVTAPSITMAPVSGFTFAPTDQHYAVLILNKVDEVFAGEAKNAFTRYNQERNISRAVTITPAKINDQYTILLIGIFDNAGDASNYADNAKSQAKGRIIPWLSADKYSFSIISKSNLDILKSGKDIPAYQQFMNTALPGKF